MIRSTCLILLLVTLAAGCAPATPVSEVPIESVTNNQDTRPDEEARPSPAEESAQRRSDDDDADAAQGIGNFWEHNDPNAAFSDDPNAVLGALNVAPGFEVNLFAAEPMIENPIQMAWDAAGRLWVICSPTYPQLDPAQERSDYIAVLEDTDGDGQADKRTVFADGLIVPTGIEFGDGGVYVASAPDLLFLADTDGDLRADVRRTVLSGFGTEDNHHAISAFVWSPGGNLHFQSGIFLHSQIETPYGVIRADDGVIFEFSPRKKKLDRYVYGSGINPWGHDFDRWGQDFQTDGAWEGIWWLGPGQVPVHARERVPNTQQISASTAGSKIISGRHMPDDMQGVLALNDFRPRTVRRYRFSDDGAGYTTTEITPPLIVSTEEYFRPVDVEMGPDGAIYVLDWYNALIGHAQYDFRDPRRDHTHGRVWRITAKDRPLVEKPQIAGASIEVLLENLKSPEDYTRHKSRRELYDRDAQQVAAALASWVAALDADDALYEHNRLEALWTYQTIDVVQPDLLRAVLRSKDPRARAAATRVLRYWRDEIPDVLDLLETQIADDHPRVRLEAVTALGHVRSPRSIEIATQALDKPMERHLRFALGLTANALESEWMPAYQAGELTFNGNAEHESFALESLNSEGAVKPLLDLLRAGQVPPSRRTAVMIRIINEGTPDALGEVFRLSFDEFYRFEAADLADVLDSFVRAARQRGVIPTSGEDFSLWNTNQIGSLQNHADPRVRQAAIRVMGAWNTGRRSRRTFERLASNGSPGDQAAAVDALAYLGGQQSIDFLSELAENGDTISSRTATVAGLTLLDLSLAATRAAAVLASDADLDPTAILTPFLALNGGAEALGAALADVEIAADVARLAIRHLNSVGRQETELVGPLARWADLTIPSEDLTTAQIKQLMDEVASRGNAERGEAVFRRADLACSNCHAISGSGGGLGPDLMGVGTASPVDYIIEAIRSPNKTIKEDYEAVIIVTTDGRFYSGIIQSQNEDELTLRDALQELVVIPTQQVEEMAKTSSLMPVGLTVAMTRDELVDLVRFLSELGKPGPYAASSVPLARRWRILSSLPDELAELSADELAAAVAGDNTLAWVPAYSTTSGILPAGDLTALGSDSVAFATTEVDVSSGGFVTLRMNSVEGLDFWIDGNRAASDDELWIEWDPGVHSVTIRVDLASRGGLGLRAEFGLATGSAARFQVVGGR